MTTAATVDRVARSDTVRRMGRWGIAARGAVAAGGWREGGVGGGDW